MTASVCVPQIVIYGQTLGAGHQKVRSLKKILQGLIDDGAGRDHVTNSSFPLPEGEEPADISTVEEGMTNDHP